MTKKTNLLRLRAVIQRTGLPRSTIYDYMNAGTFPRPIKLGERAMAWLESEIDTWIDGRISKTREA